MHDPGHKNLILVIGLGILLPDANELAVTYVTYSTTCERNLNA